MAKGMAEGMNQKALDIARNINLFNTKNLAISIIWYIFAQKQNVWQ
jgi:hypothetical protein